MNKYNPYVCVNEKYVLTYYRDLERVTVAKVFGVIQNFNPSGQTAIKDKNGMLWLIETNRITEMRPMNQGEIKRFEEE